MNRFVLYNNPSIRLQVFLILIYCSLR